MKIKLQITFCFLSLLLSMNLVCPLTAFSADKLSKKKKELKPKNSETNVAFQGFLVEEKYWGGFSVNGNNSQGMRLETNIIITTRPRDKVGNFLGINIGFGYAGGIAIGETAWARVGALGELYLLWGQIGY